MNTIKVIILLVIGAWSAVYIARHPASAFHLSPQGWAAVVIVSVLMIIFLRPSKRR